MDEFDRIRSAFPEQPGPSPEVTAEARRKVLRLAAETATVRRRHRWYAAARSGRIGMALTATAATVALAALATPLVLRPGTSPDATPVPGTVSPTPKLMTASQVLMEVALKQETDERISGRYYRVRTLQLRSTTEVGAPKYRLERRRITESWMPMKQGVASWFGWVDLGARPAGPVDQARWKAQGSPRSWQVPSEDDPVTMAAGDPVVHRMTFDVVPPGYYLSGEKPVPAKVIQDLPTDPTALRAVLARGAGSGASQDQIDYTIFTAAGRLLFELPSPPKLRGAALRVLSELPGARFQENVRDPIGRSGTEISFDWRFDRSTPATKPTTAYDGRTRYVVDPATGRLLSSESLGPKPGASVVLESGWTDESPRPPSTTVR